MNYSNSDSTLSTAYERATALSARAADLARTVSRAVQPWRLSWSAVQTLLFLEECPSPPKMRAIAGALAQETQSTTEMIDHLERDGWVQRLRDPRDRRVVLVGLTVAGAALAAEIRPLVDAACETFFAAEREAVLA